MQEKSTAHNSKSLSSGVFGLKNSKFTEKKIICFEILPTD